MPAQTCLPQGVNGPCSDLSYALRCTSLFGASRVALGCCAADASAVFGAPSSQLPACTIYPAGFLGPPNCRSMPQHNLTSCCCAKEL